ncbi:ATP synthase F1, gamma subunit [Syntrophotalea carbinolica DSM 2380]|uniref:ATP synthase gamma chain n=1 Tax=Syntrophotalea carbinolica (strain DSM 2380 / NBRC 103641 / GraBd1) TaxID=338963 RepID=Q39ZU0_SYNC1|nr:ATP synthase F1 subunit gamma [Syntrophotalea carbinolica]ABA88201.1 ATP synthase F1, gamma subunit [Syntrophotalea carbinolica DSM 2380]ABA90367.1 ATP synthase F1, gamma subunit [Syntrophotalea carbinolica DSM 2380]
MANLKDIKKRISSVKSTQQITKAMKMVAAARFRKAQAAIMAARPYAAKMQQVLASLALREDPAVHPLLQKHERRGRALVLVVSSDRGLCGGFNLNVAKSTAQLVTDNRDGFDSYELLVIGRKGREQLKMRGLIADKVYEDITADATYATAALIGQEVVEGYEQGRFDAVYLVYNAFYSAIRQEVSIDRLLPITPAEADDQTPPVQPLYEPARGEVLASILPKHVEVQIYRALLESAASEHGARMSAMDSSSKNAGEMIDNLTLQYNRVRQAVITTELVEIISGAASVQ